MENLCAGDGKTALSRTKTANPCAKVNHHARITKAGVTKARRTKENRENRVETRGLNVSDGEGLLQDLVELAAKGFFTLDPAVDDLAVKDEVSTGQGRNVVKRRSRG